jgi:uncharacterized membrane protein
MYVYLKLVFSILTINGKVSNLEAYTKYIVIFFAFTDIVHLDQILEVSLFRLFLKPVKVDNLDANLGGNLSED